MTVYLVICGCPAAYEMEVSGVYSSKKKAEEASKIAFEFQWIDEIVVDQEQKYGKVCEFAKTHKWGQGQYAQDKDGQWCMSSDPEADRFCAIGFIRGAFRSGMGEDDSVDYISEHAAEDKLIAYLIRTGQMERFSGIETWNDVIGRTEEEVQTAICKAGI